ncbi:TnsA-like heteromeric transposase endonuclease subunit [Dactylosporangium sp. NBC_01737]|nr:TnsA-like heteromeric transposase endonuclease subunit [Dactylosporangium sp. NBC_01737]
MARPEAHAGLYWSATMAAHIPYESRLELSRLLLADFDSEVTGLFAQPFRVSVTGAPGVERQWIPDFCLVQADGSLTLVEVKPARRAAAPAVAERLDSFRGVVAGYGLRFEVLSEPDPVVWANVAFLAGFRRRNHFDSSVLDALLAAAGPDGVPLAVLESRLSPRWEPVTVRPHLLHLLWSGRIVADLSRPLAGATLVRGTL